MKIKKVKVKQGFTIVELVIVIGVIGVLTAVLVPTFINLNKKAEAASQQSFLKNVNTQLAIREADPKYGPSQNMYEAMSFANEMGFDVEKISPIEGNDIVFDMKANRFAIVAPGFDPKNPTADYAKIIYSEGGIKGTGADIWKIADSSDKAAALNVAGYSIYAKETWNIGNLAGLKVGFDAGRNMTANTVSYSNAGGPTQDVIIRTNGAGTSLAVEGYVDPSDKTKGDTISHFGSAGELNVIKCATGSYHEKGKVAFAEINTGRIVLEEKSEIKHIHINANDAGTGFNEVVIRDNGAAALPAAITRDEVTVASETLVVKVESGETSENVYVYADGAQGSTEKTATQNTGVDSKLGQLVLDNGFDSKVLSEQQKESTKEEVINDARVEEYSESEAKAIPENAVAYNLNSDAYYCSGTTDYQTGMQALRGALDAAASKDTILLLNDVTLDLSGTNRFAVSKSVTINGNNHVVTTSARGFGVGMNATSKIDVTFKNLTIINNNASGRGIDTRGNLASLTLDNVTIKTPKEATQPLTIGGNQSDVVPVMIKNSTIETTEEGKWGYGITTFNPVNMTIIHSTIKGWACLNIKGPDGSAGSSGSTFSMSDTHFVSKNVYAGETNDFAAVKIEDNNVNVNCTMLGCEFDVLGTNNDQGIVAFQDLDFNPVSGCELTIGSGTTVTFEGQTYFAYSTEAGSVLNITGGSFNADPSDFVAEGYQAVEHDGIWTVIPA